MTIVRDFNENEKEKDYYGMIMARQTFMLIFAQRGMHNRWRDTDQKISTHGII